MEKCCTTDEVLNLGCYNLVAKRCCAGEGGDLGDILKKLEDLEDKIRELEEKVENCDCCDCGEQPGVEVTISLSETSKNLAADGSFQLVATVGPADLQDKSVTWSTSDPAVATVDQDGNVTAVGVGTATITATTNVGGKTATCIVTVVARSEVYSNCNLLLPFGKSFDENLGSDHANIVMASGSVTCDANNGGRFADESMPKIEAYEFSENWTTGCWVKFDVLKEYTILFGTYYNDGNHKIVGVQVAPDRVASYCNTPIFWHDTAPLQADEWYHFLINSEAEIYMNGTYLGTGEKGPSLDRVTRDIGIGNITPNPYPERYVEGYISNFFFTKTVLSREEIAEMYQLGPKPYAL